MFEKWGSNLRFFFFFKRGCESIENADFETKIRGVNSFSGEKYMILK